MRYKKVTLSIVFLLLLVFGFSIGMFSPMINNDNENIETPRASDGEITIITPENKTYTGPMSGYYPATYGFENDEDGTIPDEWQYRLTIPQQDSYIKIISSLDGHKKVVDLYKGNTYGSHLHMWNNFSDQEYGCIEFWIRTTDLTERSEFIVRNRDSGSFCAVGLGDGSNFSVYALGGWQYMPTFVASSNSWYHISIEFECGLGYHYNLDQYYFRIIINGVSSIDYRMDYDAPIANQVTILQNWLYSNYHTYLDGIGFSWDPKYNLGDNLNEGLLLSYDNYTNLDWQGYSLDAQTNNTILGNTTISYPTDGVHNVQVFGNDTMGTIYKSDLRYFTVNTAPPEITINSPIGSQTIGTTAPSYDISITGPYDTIWYTLDDGTTNYTASGLMGTLNQAAWATLSDGIITINFYANNSVGMIGTAQVQVIKDSSVVEPSPAIPGYNLFLIMGVISIIAIIIVIKRPKS